MRAWSIVGFWLTLGAAALHAQAPPPLAVRLDPATDNTAILSIGSVLDDRELAHAALSGLPLRLRVKIELWRDEFIDDLVESSAWTTVIAYEPLTRRFFVRSTAGDVQSRVFASFEGARAAIERAYPLRTLTRRPGRYYYIATLQLETLSLSDLEELSRWLKGDLQPAVSGEQSISTAISEGAKRLLIRVLGVPNRQYEARSPVFRIGPES